MQQWYVLDPATGTPAGPFSRNQLKRMAAHGRLRAESQVLVAGSGSWILAASDPELRSLFLHVPWSASSESKKVFAIDSPHDGSYSFHRAFALGWESLLARWPDWVILSVMVLALFALFTAPAVVINLIARELQRRGDLRSVEIGMFLNQFAAVLSAFLHLFLVTPLMAGFLFAAARIHEGESRLGDLFQGFRCYGAALRMGLIVLGTLIAGTALSFAPLVLILRVSSDSLRASPMFDLLVMVGILLIPTIGILIVSPAYARIALGLGIVVDPRFQGVGSIDAMQRCWSQSSGSGLSMMLLGSVTTVLAVLSVLVVGIGLPLIGMPFLCSVIGAMYVLTLQDERIA